MNSPISTPPPTPPDAAPDATIGGSTRASRTGVYIVGVIVAMAVLIGGGLAAPGFSRYLQGRQVQIIQGGVLADLHLIAEAEYAFHAQHGFFTTDLKALGIAPKSVLYKTGFTVASPGSRKIEAALELVPERKDLDALKAADPELRIEYSPVTRLNGIRFSELMELCPDCTASDLAFKSLAVANLDDDSILDVWTINEQGEILHLVDDLKTP